MEKLDNSLRKKELKDGSTIYLRRIPDTTILPEHRQRDIAKEMLRIRDSVPDRIDRVIEQMNASNYQLLLVEDENGNIIAYSTVHPPEKEGGSYLINKIAVQKDMRGKGVAKCLLQEAQSIWDYLELINIVKNEALREAMARTYRSLGFEKGKGELFIWRREKV